MSSTRTLVIGVMPSQAEDLGEASGHAPQCLSKTPLTSRSNPLAVFVCAQVLELLSPLVSDTEVPMEVAGFAALALGMVFTSSCKEEVVMSILGVSVKKGQRGDGLVTDPQEVVQCLPGGKSGNP